VVWWCWQSGRARRCFVPRLLIRARPTRLLCLMTPKAPSHTHHTSHMPSAAMAIYHAPPCQAVPQQSQSGSRRLSSNVNAAHTHSLSRSLTLKHSLSLSLQHLIASRSGRRERLIPSHNPNPPLAYPCSPPAATKLLWRPAACATQPLSPSSPSPPSHSQPLRSFSTLPLCPFPSTAGLVSPVHSLVPGPDAFSPSTLAAARRTKSRSCTTGLCATTEGATLRTNPAHCGAVCSSATDSPPTPAPKPSRSRICPCCTHLLPSDEPKVGFRLSTPGSPATLLSRPARKWRSPVHDRICQVSFSPPWLAARSTPEPQLPFSTAACPVLV
jgi:hypothetical protein